MEKEDIIEILMAADPERVERLISRRRRELTVAKCAQVSSESGLPPSEVVAVLAQETGVNGHEKLARLCRPPKSAL